KGSATAGVRGRDLYTSARDLDTLRFRADSHENEIIRTVAKELPESMFVDAAELLATNSPQNVPGEEFFVEHVHFTFEGNYLLARAMAERVEKLLGLGASSSAWLAS